MSLGSQPVLIKMDQSCPVPIRGGAVTPRERSAYNILRRNFRLISPSAQRSPAGALASALAAFDSADDRAAMASALIAAAYRGMHSKRERDQPIIHQAIDTLTGLAEIVVQGLVNNSESAVACLEELRTASKQSVSKRLERSMHDCFCTAQTIRKKSLDLAASEEFIAVPIDEWWNSINCEYKRGTSTGRLVSKDDVVRTRASGTLAIPSDYSPARCSFCNRRAEHANEFALCRCLSSRACPSCIDRGCEHACQPVLTRCAGAATTLSVPFLPAIVLGGFILPLPVSLAVRHLHMGVLLPDAMSDADVNVLIAHPATVLDMRRQRGTIAQAHCERMQSVLAEDQAERVRARDTRTARSHRRHRDKKKRLADERVVKQAAEAAEAERRTRAVRALQAVQRRRAHSRMVAVRANELVAELREVTTLERAASVRRRLGSDCARYTASDATTREILRCAVAAFDDKWLPELRARVEQRLHAQAVADDAVLERTRQERLEAIRHSVMRRQQRWAERSERADVVLGRVAVGVALSVLADE